MSLSIFLQLETYLPGPSSPILAGESEAVLPAGPLVAGPHNSQGLIALSSFSYSMEQTLNIGSTSSGSGGGKVTFNPFALTKRVDRTSPVLWEMLCSGTPFKTARLFFVRNNNAGPNGVISLRLEFTLAAVKTIALTVSEEGETFEALTFEAGGMQVWYTQQMPDGTLGKPVTGGWDRVKNIKAEAPLD